MIPIEEAKKISKQYGYEQVIIIGRKVDTEEELGHETVTTYGKDKVHCEIAAKTGDFLKYKVMGWEYPQPLTEDRRKEHLE